MNYSFFDLFLPSFSIFFIGLFVITFYFKSFKYGLIISSIKSGLFFIYFAYFFHNAGFTFLDDIRYLNISSQLANNYNITYFIFKPFALLDIIGSKNFLYYFINMVSIKLFGNYYFSPVTLNIILIYFIAIILYKILNFLNIKIAYVISLFYLIQWDILSWEILNFKDFWVQFLTLLFIYNLLKFDKYKNIKYLISILVVMSFLFTLRFYIPYLIIASFFIFKFYLFFLEAEKKTIYYIIGLLFFIIGIIILNTILKSELHLFLSHFTNPFVGIIRYLLTPLPFHMENGYEFLLFASLLNFLLFPLFLYGIYLFYKIDSKYKYFILSYFSVLLLFYGCFIELQGPRHKIQILPFISLFQFYGFYGFLQFLIGYKDEKNKFFN